VEKIENSGRNSPNVLPTTQYFYTLIYYPLTPTPSMQCRGEKRKGKERKGCACIHS